MPKAGFFREDTGKCEGVKREKRAIEREANKFYSKNTLASQMLRKSSMAWYDSSPLCRC